MIKECICQGNKKLQDLSHMRELGKKAAILEDSVLVLYKRDGIYKFEKETEHDNKNDIIEYIYP